MSSLRCSLSAFRSLSMLRTTASCWSKYLASLTLCKAFSSSGIRLTAWVSRASRATTAKDSATALRRSRESLPSASVRARKASSAFRPSRPNDEAACWRTSWLSSLRASSIALTDVSSVAPMLPRAPAAIARTDSPLSFNMAPFSGSIASFAAAPILPRACAARYRTCSSSSARASMSAGTAASPRLAISFTTFCPSAGSGEANLPMSWATSTAASVAQLVPHVSTNANHRNRELKSRMAQKWRRFGRMACGSIAPDYRTGQRACKVLPRPHRFRTAPRTAFPVDNFAPERV